MIAAAALPRRPEGGRVGKDKWQGRRAGAFIFDLDGTLIDSGRDIALSANFVRGHFGLPELAPDVVLAYVGDGASLLVRRVLSHDGAAAPDPQVDEGLEVFREHYGRHCLDHTRLYPGVLETLRHFRLFPLAVATNKPRAFAVKILDGLKVGAAFRRVVCADDVAHRKPDPEPLRRCLEGLAVPPAQVVVVGDSLHDVQAARALGACAVGAAYGLTPAGRLREAGPDLCIGGFAELRDLFPSRPEPLDRGGRMA